MTPLETYLSCKRLRALAHSTPTLDDVLKTFKLSSSLGNIRPIDIASADNRIEIVRSGDEIWLIFDHNYFYYSSDLIACYFSRDDEGMQRHLNYVINRFMLEVALPYDSYELKAGLLHAILMTDVEGANPLGQSSFEDARALHEKLNAVRGLQFRFCAAHEIAHAAIVIDHDSRRSALSRLRYLVEELHTTTGRNTAESNPGADAEASMMARLASALSGDQPISDSAIEEFLCDNLAADALGEAAARGGAPIGLAGYDLAFAIDAHFLLMWFLEALRFRIEGLFDQAAPGWQSTHPHEALWRGSFATLQFLVSYLAGSKFDTRHIYEEVRGARESSEEMLGWLQQNLDAAQADENLESLVKLGARCRTVYGLSTKALNRAAAAALGWDAESES